MTIQVPGTSPEQLQKFEQYLSVIPQWYSKQGAAAIRDIQVMTQRHFLESVALIPFLGDAKSLLDLGVGAGIPGLPIAVMRPELQVTIMESESTKAGFCAEVVRVCALSNVTIAESSTDNSQMTRLGVFDTVVSRGNWSLKDYLPAACRFLEREEGHVIALKNAHYQQELVDLDLSALKLAVPEVHELPTGDCNATHRTVLIFTHHKFTEGEK